MNDDAGVAGVADSDSGDDDSNNDFNDDACTGVDDDSHKHCDYCDDDCGGVDHYDDGSGPLKWMMSLFSAAPVCHGHGGGCGVRS